MLSDTQGVMRLFAVAARAVCEKPDLLEDVSRQLEVVTQGLVPPEAAAGQECTRLWRGFARSAGASKAASLREAGQAFYRELDAVGQRLDLSPVAGLA